MQNIKEYFNIIASKRKGRGLSNYYWKEITNYCNYFSHEDSSVLEVGCGSGDLLSGIAGSRKVGIDFSEGQIAWAKEKHAGKNIEFVLMDANNITLTEKYDFIIISNLIGFVEDIQVVFEQVQKVCHPNTKIIVQYYNSLWEPALKFAELIGLKTKTPTQNWLNTKDVNNLLFVSGFDVYRNSKRFIFPFYIPLIAELHNLFLAKFPFFRFFSLNTYSFAKPLPLSNPDDYKTKYSTTVVIPARNESGNIENAITRLPKFGKHVEIIFIEGNSTDDTWQKIQEIQQKYKDTHDIKIGQQKGKGKADAVREGYKIATGDILMILDADLTVPPEDIPKFYDAIAGSKGDFINGTRLVYPMEGEAMRFIWMIEKHKLLKHVKLHAATEELKKS